MINNILSRITTDSATLLDEAKEKVFFAAKKMAGSKIPPTPSPQQFIQELKKLDIRSEIYIQKAVDLYNKINEKIDAALGVLNGLKSELENIKNKIDKISANFDRLNDIVETIQPIVNILRNLIPAFDAILATQNPATGINGATLKRTFDNVDTAKEKVGKFLDAVSNIPDFAATFNEEIRPLTTPLNSGISMLNGSIAKIESLKQLIQTIYDKFIGSLSFPEVEDLAEDTENLDPSSEEIVDTITNNSNNPNLVDVFKITTTNNNRTGYEYTKEESS